MLTNLVAAITITVVTNVSEQVTGYGRYVPAPCPDWATNPGYGCLVNHTKGVDPNHKTITTNVVEITTLTFDWRGQKRELKQERIIESKSASVALQWVPTTNPPVATLPYSADNYWIMTNVISGAILLQP